MIHKTIMDCVKARLERDLLSSAGNDDAAAGVVKLGPLQGDPDPDVARISVEIYENDPDQEIRGSGISTTDQPWKDEVAETEIGGGVIWRRRFTVKARVLLENSREDLENTRRIASTVRSRLERALLQMRFAGVESDGEAVVLGPLSENMTGEMLQAGGPPDAYDFFLKVRFEVLTAQQIMEE